MRRMCIRGGFFALAVAGVFLLCGCAGQPAPGRTRVQVDESASGSRLRLVRGQELAIELVSNPTTGYDWYLRGVLPSQLTTSSDSYETTAEPGVVGAGGTHVFVYSATAVGTGTLQLDYARAWETGVPPVKTFTLRVTVE